MATMMFAMPIICESSYIESSACTHGCKACAPRRIGLSIEELGTVEFVDGSSLVNVLHGRFIVSLNARAFQEMAIPFRYYTNLCLTAVLDIIAL